MTDFATSASQDTLKLRLAAALPDHLPWGLPLGALLRPTDSASLRQGGLLGFLAPAPEEPLEVREKRMIEEKVFFHWTHSPAFVQRIALLTEDSRRPPQFFH